MSALSPSQLARSCHRARTSLNCLSHTGNEEDHIIISVVRTQKVGFLKNRRRSNVMLSRCKQSMYICTNRSFVTGKAASTLLGELVRQWGGDAWTGWRDVRVGTESGATKEKAKAIQSQKANGGELLCIRL